MGQSPIAGVTVCHICCLNRISSSDEKGGIVALQKQLANGPSRGGGGEEVYAQSRALIFIKTHATTEAVKAALRSHLQSFGIRVLLERETTGEAAKLSGVVDRHFGVIASKAVKLKPHELTIKSKKQEEFKRLFGLSWAQALQKNLVVNAIDALDHLEIAQEEFVQKYDRLNRNRDEVKLGDGFYCGRVGGLYVINGFYLRLRGLYTGTGVLIDYYEVAWPTSSLSWSELRTKVIGDTDPSEAREGSFRRRISDDWVALGLAARPNINDNALHVSASSFESMVERANWLGHDILDDPLTRVLRDQAGVPLKTLKAWVDDPTIYYRKQRSTLFDVLTDLDAQQCVLTAAQIIHENE